ncbi:MAG: hypothetical protein ACXADW_20075 [Candidatus Hodarchaeales archaeon]
MSQYLDRTTLHDEEKEIEDQQPIVDHVITNRTDLVVFNALKEHQPATRMDLCDKTGIARTTIYDALTRLMVKKVIVKYTPPVKKKGRPKVFYRTISE